MFDITKLYLKIPKFLSEEECDYLINYHDKNSDHSYIESSTEAITEKERSSTFKAVSIQPNTDAFFLARNKTKEAIKNYVNYLDSSKCFHKSIRHVLKYSHNYRILKYDVGGKIHSHSDHDPLTYGSVSINLNNDYEGGKFLLFNGAHEVELGRGDLLVFPADYFWTHEVTEVTKGKRYSLNSFILKYPNEVRHLLLRNADPLEIDYLKNMHKDYVLGPYNN